MKNKNENEHLDVSIWAVDIHQKTAILHMKRTSHLSFMKLYNFDVVPGFGRLSFVRKPSEVCFKNRQ